MDDLCPSEALITWGDCDKNGRKQRLFTHWSLASFSSLLHMLALTLPECDGPLGSHKLWLRILASLWLVVSFQPAWVEVSLLWRNFIFSSFQKCSRPEGRREQEHTGTRLAMLGRPLGSLFLCGLVLKTGLGLHTFPQLLVIRENPSKARSKESCASQCSSMGEAEKSNWFEEGKQNLMVQTIIQATREVEAGKSLKQFSLS